jgi:hypothetical protein
MRSAIEELTKRKSRKRRYVQREGSSYKNGETPTKRVRAKRHYGRYGEIRHNSRTCKVEIEDADDSEESEV